MGLAFIWARRLGDCKGSGRIWIQASGSALDTAATHMVMAPWVIVDLFCLSCGSSYEALNPKP